MSLNVSMNGVLFVMRVTVHFCFSPTSGNLERECIEEICDHEEAREVFEQTDKTVRLHFVLLYLTVSSF